MSEWQPIETAPRDETGGEIEREFILILLDERTEHTYRVQTGFWNSILKHWQPCDDTSPDIQPTHWQPLPSPPSERRG